MMTKKLFSRVQITTNSRLHFGFLNINSRENYSFGDMGLSIDKYPTITTISKAREFKSNLSRALNKKIEGFIKCNKVNKNIEIKYKIIAIDFFIILTRTMSSKLYNNNQS